MAPLPVIANVYRVALEWTPTIGGNPVNVLHFRGTPGSAAGLYTAINANVTTQMWAFTSSDLVVLNVKITPLDGSSATVVNATGAPSKWTGASGGDWIPAAAAVLSLRTAKRGAAYRGRVYFPALPEGVQTAGTLAIAETNLVLAAWVAFRTAVAAAGYTQVVASYTHATAELVTSQGINSRYGVQRRRQSS